MKTKIQTTLATGVSLFAPLVAFGATQQTLSTFIGLLSGYLSQILLLIMGLAVLMFVWYVVKYFIMPNEGSESRKEAGLYVLYSVIGFFVILSFWGLVNILQNTFNLDNTSNTPSSWASFGNIFPK